MAIGLFTGLSVAPAAAQVGNDSLLDEDGISIGGDSGVDVGVDDGVEVGVGGDSGVNVDATTDEGVGASVAGEEGVDVGASPNEGVDANVAGRDLTGGAPTDVASGVDSIGGGSAPDVLGSSTLPSAESPLPSGESPLPGASGEGINLTDTTGVQVCDFTRLDSSKLPTSTLPGLDALPQDMAPPGVPTNLLTAETVLGLATGPVPGLCEAVDLNDPQLDPSDPPTEPDYTASTLRFQSSNGQFAYWGVYSGTLNESGDGPSYRAEPGLVVNRDTLNAKPEFLFNVGEGDYGFNPVLERDNDSVRLRGVAVFVGKGAGGELACSDLKEFDGDLSQENLADLGPCEYELVGIPSLVTPEDFFQIIGSAGEGGLPVDPGGGLPIDSLLSL